MNILFVDQFSEPGGAQLALLDILDAVVHRGWNPLLLAPGHGALLQEAAARRIPAHSLPMRSLTNGSKTAADVIRYFADLPVARAEIARLGALQRADILYINGPRLLPAAIGFDIPVIFHAHSFVNGIAPRALAIHTLRRSKATLMAASRFAAAPFKWAARSRTHIVYNGSPDLRTPRERNRRDRLRVGVVGRIAPEKGQLDFVQAVRKLGTDAACFTIHGSSLFGDVDYDQKVRSLAEGTQVRFEPWSNDFRSIYSNLDILAVPSLANEASTRVIMEAFSAGVAVIAYPSGGIPEMVDSGKTGVLTQSARPDQLASSIRTLLDDRPLLESLTHAGRTEWERRFTKKRFQTSVCEVIEATHSGRAAAVRTDARCRIDSTASVEHAPR